MEPGMWTDERVEEMVVAHESQFELLRNDLRETEGRLRAEMKEMEASLRGEIGQLRTDMTGMEASLRGEIGQLRGMTQHFLIAVLLIIGGQSAALLALLD